MIGTVDAEILAFEIIQKWSRALEWDMRGKVTAQKVSCHFSPHVPFMGAISFFDSFQITQKKTKHP